MLLFHAFGLCIIGSVLASNSEVTTPLGKILGSTLTTRLGRTIYAFRGIRYAQPPVNDLRFKPPVPVQKWNGIYNATEDGPVCPQPNASPTSEDCLMLNIYTTKLPDGQNPKRPVIIFLHPGGFFAYSGRSNWAGPEYFLDQDIVLVTINYRIGSLGFLSIGKVAPGNNGLKDQVMAMKWVKNNIEAFGGDPDCVTLYGYSAGARSVSLHMVSPMSQGLFHRAILGSGSSLGHWLLPRNQLNVAKKQAQVVGCPDANPQEILNCLKTKSADELGNSLFKFREFGTFLGLIWAPVIEEDYGQERFLTENPIKLYKRGDFQKIPVIAGVTRDEFAAGAFVLLGNATLLKELDDSFEKYAPLIFLYERGTEKSREVSRAVRKFYFENEPLSNASFDGLTKIFADSNVGFPVNRAVNLMAAKNTKDVYYYQFTYQGRYSYFYLPGTNNTVSYGVVHHDDLIYSFHISLRFPLFNRTDPETEMVDTLTSMWANFAKTGKPIPKSNPKFNGVKWDTYNTNTKKYLEIGKKLVLKQKMFDERYKFWEKLYPLSLYH